MTKQITLEGKEAIQANLLKRREYEELYADENIDTGDLDVYYMEQQEKAREFFGQHEKHPLDAGGYVRVPGPCGSTHLQLAKPIDYSKEPDCIRYFECWHCKRKIDRAKEGMWSWSPTQVLGLAVPMHNYCWDCYQIVSKEGKGLGGITGREFANVASEIITDRRRGFGR